MPRCTARPSLTLWRPRGSFTCGSITTSGLALGTVVPLLVGLAWRLPILTAKPRPQALGPQAVAVLLYATCRLTHANPHLAAFAAGSTLATTSRTAAEQVEPFGELLSEVTKFAALLVFGALITPDRLSHLSVGGWFLAVLAILLVRPAALLLSLHSSTDVPVARALRVEPPDNLPSGHPGDVVVEETVKPRRSPPDR